jgi:hypothetical protein
MAGKLPAPPKIKTKKQKLTPEQLSEKKAKAKEQGLETQKKLRGKTNLANVRLKRR